MEMKYTRDWESEYYIDALDEEEEQDTEIEFKSIKPKHKSKTKSKTKEKIKDETKEKIKNKTKTSKRQSTSSIELEKISTASAPEKQIDKIQDEVKYIYPKTRTKRKTSQNLRKQKIVLQEEKEVVLNQKNVKPVKKEIQHSIVWAFKDLNIDGMEMQEMNFAKLMKIENSNFSVSIKNVRVSHSTGKPLAIISSNKKLHIQGYQVNRSKEEEVFVFLQPAHHIQSQNISYNQLIFNLTKFPSFWLRDSPKSSESVGLEKILERITTKHLENWTNPEFMEKFKSNNNYIIKDNKVLKVFLLIFKKAYGDNDIIKRDKKVYIPIDNYNKIQSFLEKYKKGREEFTKIRFELKKIVKSNETKLEHRDNFVVLSMDLKYNIFNV